MGNRGRTFSTYDGWIIDIFASIGAAVIVFATLMGIHKAIFPYHPEDAGGGGALALSLIFLFVMLVRLRIVRERRDAGAEEEEGSAATPAGRARRGGR